jgi:hypothetical protein
VANMISVSLIAPTLLWITLTLISSVLSFSIDAASASTDPSTSPLIIRLRVCTCPALICS